MSARYDVREDDAGLTVFDVWTGETVVIAGVQQTGLTPSDAGELVGRLNRRAAAGIREVLQ